MPRYKPSDEETALYSGPVKPPAGASAPAADPSAEAPPGPKPGQEAAEPRTTDEEIGQDQNTAIVSSKVLMKPGGEMPREGEEVTVRVVKVYGDGEVEIKYAPEKQKPGQEDSPMSSADGEIEAMDSKDTY